jgi:4-hydroxy-2-oxoheptanedioate aldolase
MRENLLRTLWQEDAYAVNGWLCLPATFSAEVMAHRGWDSLTIDLQHGLIDYQSAVGILQAISTTRTVPLVRVPWLDPAIIMKVLDAGAYGVICPMINSAAEAAAFVAACRYPPQAFGVVARFGRTSTPGRIILRTRIGPLSRWQ